MEVKGKTRKKPFKKIIVGLIRGGGVGPELGEALELFINVFNHSGDVKIELRRFDPQLERKYYDFMSHDLSFHEEKKKEDLVKHLKRFIEEVWNEGGVIIRGPINAYPLYALRRELELRFKLVPLIPVSLKRTKFNNLPLVLTRLVCFGGLFHQKGKEVRDGVEVNLFYAEKEIRDYMKAAFQLAVELAKKKERELSVGLIMQVGKLGELGKLWFEIFRKFGEEYGVEIDWDYPDLEPYILRERGIIRERGPLLLVGPEFSMDSFMDNFMTTFMGLNLAPSAHYILRREVDFSEAVYSTLAGTKNPIAGRGMVSPISALLTLAMAFEWSWGMIEIAERIKEAILETLSEGYRTPDICFEEGKRICTTRSFLERVIENYRW